MDYILILLVLFPLFGAALIGLSHTKLARKIALVTVLGNLIIGVVLAFLYNPNLVGINQASSMQFVGHFYWIRSINASLYFGIDGLSFPFILLSLVIGVVVIIASDSIQKYKKPIICCVYLCKQGFWGYFVL